MDDYDSIPEDSIIIKDHHKLFGVPTPTRTNQSPKLFLLTHTLDIMLGNMQKTIIKQIIKQNIHGQPMTATSLICEWHYHMTDSLNLITERMKRKPYTTNWVFTKPDSLDTPTISTWKSVLKSFLDASLSEDYPLHVNVVSSDLQSSQLSSDL